MYIEQNARSEIPRQAATVALRLIIAQPTYEQERPCSRCNILCDDCGSRACTCRCNLNCPFAPSMLSTGEGQPIETHVLPLVFELASLRLMHPNWSCEGHEASNGKTLAKIPRVWFQPDSPVYVNLLLRILLEMTTNKILRYSWRVVVISFETTHQTYSLEPDLTFVPEPQLQWLHRDLHAIASRLRGTAKLTARGMMRDLAESPASR
jgi:hypothetical protein